MLGCIFTLQGCLCNAIAKILIIYPFIHSGNLYSAVQKTC